MIISTVSCSYKILTQNDISKKKKNTQHFNLTMCLPKKIILS